MELPVTFVLQHESLEQQNVRPETNGSGIQLYSADVELVDVAVVDCSGNGIYAGNVADASPSQLVATRCEMSNNATGLGWN